MSGIESVAPERQPTNHIYYSMTQSLCATCARGIDAKIQLWSDGVYLAKFCPQHGAQRVRVSSSVSWYLDALSFLSATTAPSPTLPVKHGCPRDCGPCSLHQQRAHRGFLAFDGSEATTASLVHARVVTGARALTLLPPRAGQPVAASWDAVIEGALAGPLEVRLDANIDWDLVPLERLGQAGVALELALPVHAPDDDAAVRAILDRLAAHGIDIALARTVTTANDLAGLGRVLDWFWEVPGASALRLALHHPLDEAHRLRLSIPDVHQALSERSRGRLHALDFVPLADAHPHCFSVCPLAGSAGGLLPLARSMPRSAVYEVMAGAAAGAPDPARLQAAWNTHAAATHGPWPEAVGLKRIDIHDTMDVAGFDVGRAMKCPLAVVQGTLQIPPCIHAFSANPTSPGDPR